MQKSFLVFKETGMTRLIYPVLLVLMAAACTAVDHSPKMPPEEVKAKLKEADYLKSQIAAKDMKIIEEEKTTAEIRREIDKIHSNCEKLSDRIDKKLVEAEKLMAEIRDLNRKLGPPSPEDEKAAEKLLLEARYFQRDNPTEAKPVIASKYKLVFDRFPRTKAAKEARKVYELLSK
jgi:septal ring factor EnvC (AmiA/AmiB activator)